MITKEQALKIIKNKSGWVHSFKQSGYAIFGCDYSVEEFTKTLEQAKYIEIGGETCQKMSHALCLDKELFFETVENFQEIINQTGGEFES